MNTEFFKNASDITKDFSWKDIFSDVFASHTKEQSSRQMARGMRGNVPSPSEMLQQWQKPWLFLRAAAIALVLTILSVFCVMFFGYTLGIPLLFVVPAFAIPLAVLVFYWEMNIPGDISLLETVGIMLIGGMLALIVGYFITSIGDWPDAAYITAPWPEEIAKFLIVYLILTRSKYRYGTQGILVGGAVGAGFAAIETSGYALNAMFSSAVETGSITYSSLNYMLQLQLVRGLLAVGGHTVWAALYGGALGLAKKGQEKLPVKKIFDPLVLMTLSAAVMMHTFWNLDLNDLVYIFPDGFVNFLYQIQQVYVNYIILIILAWLLLLFVMRKCIRQIVAASPVAPGDAVWQEEKKGDTTRQLEAAQAAARQAQVQAAAARQAAERAAYQRTPEAVLLRVTATGSLNAGKTYELHRGDHLIFGRDPARANVTFPADTKGVSSVHCEIKEKEGYLVLIDRNSTYGTFFSNGTKLEANTPYKLKGDVRFYLASEQNEFLIQVVK